MNTRYLTFAAILAACLFIFSSGKVAAQETPSGHFVADEHPEIIEILNSHECGQGVADALADAGTNWTELWGALQDLDGILYSHGCWLVVNMPHLDRIEMTRNTFLEHVRFAYLTRTDLPYKVPDELFREYILTYRIGDEPVRPWRSAIWFGYPDLKADTMTNTARHINQWVADNLKVRDRGFYGPRPDPLSTISAGSGTAADIATVAIAMCKTFGVAARQTRISVLGEEPGDRTWLEIYTDDGRWVPMYPDNPAMFGNPRWIEHGHPHNVTVVASSSAFSNIQVTPAYSQTGTIKLNFTRNGETVPDFEFFAISAWNNGAWLPLDDLGFDLEESRMSTEEQNGFAAVLGDGFYLVQAGVRNARGDAYVQTFPVTLNADDTVELTIPLDVPVSEEEAVDLVQRIIDPLPEVQLNYAPPLGLTEEWFPRDLPAGQYVILVLFDPTSEPSVRMVPSVAAWAKNNGATLLGVGVGDPSAAAEFWSANTDGQPEIHADPDGTIANAFGHPKDEQGKYSNLPMVMLLTPERKIIYLSDGYNLAVADGLSRAMELAP